MTEVDISSFRKSPIHVQDTDVHFFQRTFLFVCVFWSSLSLGDGESFGSTIWLTFKPQSKKLNAIRIPPIQLSVTGPKAGSVNITLIINWMNKLMSILFELEINEIVKMPILNTKAGTRRAKPLNLLRRRDFQVSTLPRVQRRKKEGCSDLIVSSIIL